MSRSTPNGDSAHHAQSRGRRGPLGTLAAALAVAAKELFEGFRDRQTLIYTFVLPVCMYPALFWVMVQGVLVVQGQKGAKDVRVAVVAPAEIEDAVVEAIQVAGRASESGSGAGDEVAGEDAAGEDAADERAGDESPQEPPAESAPAPHSGRVTVSRLTGSPPDEDALRAMLASDDDEAPDAVLVLRGSADAEAPAELYFDSTKSRSEIARGRVVSSLRQWATGLRGQRAEERAVDPEVLAPILVEVRSVAEDKDEGALVLSLMLPMLLVVMSVLGAFFPAVDLTAGEKERGTAETTMLLPVPRTGVHLGKILAVCAAAMIATVLNLLALALSAGHLLQQLSTAASESISVQIPVQALLSITPLAALFSFFVAASLTGIASLAASFKEGQALLGPVQMVFILPAMAASLPGMTLDATTAWIPVVNVALAFRGMLVGDVATGALLSCAAALLVYAAIAIWFSVRLRSNEAVALAGETLSLRRMAGLLKGGR